MICNPTSYIPVFSWINTKLSLEILFLLKNCTNISFSSLPYSLCSSLVTWNLLLSLFLEVVTHFCLGQKISVLISVSILKHSQQNTSLSWIPIQDSNSLLNFKFSFLWHLVFYSHISSGSIPHTFSLHFLAYLSLSLYYYTHYGTHFL